MINGINILTAEKFNVTQACIEMSSYAFYFKETSIKKVSGSRNDAGALTEESETLDGGAAVTTLEYSANLWSSFAAKGKVPSIPLLDTDFEKEIRFDIGDHENLVQFWNRLDKNMSDAQKAEKMAEEHIKTVLINQLRTAN